MNRSRILPNLALLAASLVCVLVAGEVGFRAFEAAGLRVEDEKSVVFPTTSHTGKFRLSNNPVLGVELDPADPEINRDGFRGADVDVAKGDTVRIAALGDSVTFGFGVPLEQAYPHRLERMLNEGREPGARRYEVLNLGVGGYNARQVVEIYRNRARKYAPDLLLLAYVLNDVFPAGAHLQSTVAQAFGGAPPPTPDARAMGRAKPAPAASPPANLRPPAAALPPANPLPPAAAQRPRLESRLLRFIWERSHELFQGRELRPAGWIAFYRDPRTWSIVTSAFAELAEMARSDGTPVLVVIFPELVGFGDDYPYAAVHRKVGQEARRRGFAVFDLLEPFRDLAAEPLRLTPVDATHPNATGLGIAAEAIHAYLLRSGLLDRIEKRRS